MTGARCSECGRAYPGPRKLDGSAMLQLKARLDERRDWMAVNPGKRPPKRLTVPAIAAAVGVTRRTVARYRARWEDQLAGESDA